MKSLKLSTKLIVGGLIISLVPLMIIGIFTGITASNALEELEKEQLVNLKRTAIALINTKFNEQITLLVNASTNDATIAEITRSLDTSGISEMVQFRLDMSSTIYHDRNTYEILYITDKKGRVIGDISGKNLKADLSETDYFRSAIRGDTVIGKVIRSEKTGLPYVIVAGPMKTIKNDIIGAIIIGWKIDELNKKINDLRFGTTGYAFIIDKDGIIISHPNQSSMMTDIKSSAKMAAVGNRMLSSKDGVEKCKCEGDEKLISFGRIETSGWSIGLIISESEYMSPVERMRYIVIIVGLLIGILFTFEIFRFIRRNISRPISSLIASVRSIAEGNYNIPVIWEKHDEIGMLVADVDRMRLSIRYLTENLISAEKKYRTIFENAIEGIFQSSPSGYFISANPAMAEILGYDSSDELLASVTDLGKQIYVNPGDREKMIAILVNDGEVIGFRGELYRKDRSIIWVSLSARAVYDDHGSLLLIEGFLTDITEAVEKQKAEREREIAERANHSKSEFLANMSHEIRTPMNAILGFTELLVPLVADGQQRNYLQAIQASGKSLLTLINDILDLSKIEAGKLEIRYEPVNPYAVFDEIRQIFALRISQKNLEFVTEVSDDIPKSLLLDEIRLRQVLFNLIGNSVKFTEKGYIKLSADRIFTADDRSRLDLIIRVEDTGIGIEPEAQERIFQAFIQQEGQSTRKYGGTGLGLAISRRLIRMMNGEITLSSEPGKGSVFRIILRDVAAAGTVPESERNKLTDSQNFIFQPATILVTDDVETNRLLIKAFFDNTDIRSIEAENGQQAVAAAEQFIPSLILMDITMPVMDGYEAVKRIRDNEKTKHIPVIALTARAMSQEKDRIFSAGFDGYLTKPVRRSELFRELSRFLPHREDNARCEVRNNENGADCLLPQTVEKLPEIIGRLESEFTPLWENVCQKQFIDEIEDFASRIVKFAEEYSIKNIADFGHEIITHCQNCDIENIESVMKSYPKLIGSFRSGG